MIIAITKFVFATPMSLDAARSLFESTAPKYRNVPGLFQKHYMLAEGGASAGGVYLWNSRQEAEALYTDAWRAFVKAKFGSEPSISYFDSPVLVDNLAEQILVYPH